MTSVFLLDGGIIKVSSVVLSSPCIFEFHRIIMTRRHYEVAVAVLITLVAVFGFLWFSGVEDSTSMEAALPGSLEELGVQ